MLHPSDATFWFQLPGSNEPTTEWLHALVAAKQNGWLVTLACVLEGERQMVKSVEIGSSR